MSSGTGSKDSDGVGSLRFVTTAAVGDTIAVSGSSVTHLCPGDSFHFIL